MILANLITIKISVTVLNLFTKCSGLKINVDKTQDKYICYKLTFDYFPMSWIKTLIETPGIVIRDNEEKNYNYNYQNKIANLKTIL